jgi:peptide deformylase
MAILPILTYPDPRLREISKPVEKVTPEIQKLVDDMLETMAEANGIGLAAPQVGELIRLLVIDLRRPPEPDEEDQPFTDLEKKVSFPLVLINPVVVKGEGKTSYEEGCLSVPGYYEEVQRFNWVRVEALDRDGRQFNLETDGLLAICIQHEMDHLEGKLFIDRLSFVKSNKIKNKIQKVGYPVKKEREKAREKLKAEE